jgi:hypothetical protein
MKPLKRDIIVKARNDGYILGNKGAVYWLCFNEFKHNGKKGIALNNSSLNDVNIFLDNIKGLKCK